MMLESTLQAMRKSIAYSDKFLAGTYTSEPYSGSANVEDVLQLQDATRNFSRRWPEKKDPITQSNLIESEEVLRFSIVRKNIVAITQSNLIESEEIESEEEEVQELIYQIKASNIRYRDKIANQLITLFKDSKEEDPYSSGITAGSLRNFVNFLELYPNVKYPSISLTPEHNIYVSWRDEYNRLFSIHFLPNKDTRFVIFMPNYRHPERKIRISGITTVDVLMETVAFYRVTDWIFNER
jgi:hypothetical protein